VQTSYRPDEWFIQNEKNSEQLWETKFQNELIIGKYEGLGINFSYISEIYMKSCQ
jgi:hypothetical protein